MLFSSITFLYCFLPCVLLVYFIVPDRMKNFVLLSSSLLFYGCENGMEIMTASFVQMFHLCSEYFKSKNADVERDKLFILNYAIRLSDHDFSEMLKEILAVVDRYQGKNIPKDANTRNLYLMSLPAGGDTNEP